MDFGGDEIPRDHQSTSLSIFEFSKTPSPVVLGGGILKGELSALPSSVQLYMEARKKRYPTKERMLKEKQEREIRIARGELVDIPSFEYLVNDFKKQKKRGGKHSKSQSQPTLLNKLFQKTVVTEHVGLLQCIRYLVAHNFLAKEGELPPVSDNPARQREVFANQGGGAKKEWTKGGSKNRKRQFPKEDAMSGTTNDGENTNQSEGVGANNNSAANPDATNANFDRKGNKWQNKKRKFDRNNQHQHARQQQQKNTGPRSIIGYPAKPDESSPQQQPTPLPPIVALNSNNNNSASVTAPLMSFPPRPVHSQSLPLPVFAPPSKTQHSYQQHNNSNSYGHQKPHNQQQQQQHYQQYAHQSQPLIPPPYHATQAWSQPQQYQQMGGMYPPPLLQNQQQQLLPSPNFAAVYQQQQQHQKGSHYRAQNQQRPAGGAQSSDELRRKIKMMNNSQ